MAQLEAGYTLGTLKILRLLGSGGMADVYEAEDTRLGRKVAVKVLPPEYSRNQDFIARFEREVKASAALSHTNIVTVFEFGSVDNLNYYTMRLLPGGDLRKRIADGMSIVDVLMTLRGVLQAFQHAHARGFVHRDVKPENIMFDEQGTPTLTDFGIAKALDSHTRMTQTGMAVGTPRYISPEQAMGKEVDGRSDLYSLGCILYEMLMGSVPYKADTPIATIFQHVNEPVPELSEEYATFAPLLQGLMAKKPEDRLQDAASAMRMLDQTFPSDWTGTFDVSRLTQARTGADAPTPAETPIRQHTAAEPRAPTPPPAPPAAPPPAPLPKKQTPPPTPPADPEPTLVATPAAGSPVDTRDHSAGHTQVIPSVPPEEPERAPTEPTQVFTPPAAKAPASKPAKPTPAPPPSPQAEPTPAPAARAEPGVGGGGGDATQVIPAARIPEPARRAPARRGPPWALLVGAALLIAGVLAWLLWPRDATEAETPAVPATPAATPVVAPSVEPRALPSAPPATPDPAAQRRAQEEAQRRAQEQAEAERRARAQAEADRRAREQAEADRKAREQAEAERRAREQSEAERRADAERRARIEAERRAQQEAQAEQEARDEAAAQQRARDQAEADRRAREQAEAEQRAREKAAAERRAREQAEAERRARAEAEAERLQREEAERLERERQARQQPTPAAAEKSSEEERKERLKKPVPIGF